MKIILNILIAIACVLASIFLLILTPFYFIIKFIGWVFGLVNYLDNISTDYIYLWIWIWEGEDFPRFY